MCNPGSAHQGYFPLPHFGADDLSWLKRYLLRVGGQIDIDLAPIAELQSESGVTARAAIGVLAVIALGDDRPANLTARRNTARRRLALNPTPHPAASRGRPF